MATTYYYTNVASDVTVASSTSDVLTQTAPAAADNIVITAGGHATTSVFIVTASDDPGAAGVAGNFTLAIDVSLGSNCTCQARLWRVNSLGVLQGSGSSFITIGAGGGGGTWTSLDLGPWGTGDRLAVEVQFINSGGPSQGCEIFAGPIYDPTYNLSAPWSAGGGGGATNPGGYYYFSSLSDITTSELSHINSSPAPSQLWVHEMLDGQTASPGVAESVTIPANSAVSVYYATPAGDPGTLAGVPAEVFGHLNVTSVTGGSITVYWQVHQIRAGVEQNITGTPQPISISAAGNNSIPSPRFYTWDWQAGDRLVLELCFVNGNAGSATVNWTNNTTQGGFSANPYDPEGDFSPYWAGGYGGDFAGPYNGVKYSYNDTDATCQWGSSSTANIAWGAWFNAGYAGGGLAAGDALLMAFGVYGATYVNYPAGVTIDWDYAWFDSTWSEEFRCIGAHYIWQGTANEEQTVFGFTTDGNTYTGDQSMWAAQGAGGLVTRQWAFHPPEAGLGDYFYPIPGVSSGALEKRQENQTYMPGCFIGTFLAGSQYVPFSFAFVPSRYNLDYPGYQGVAFDEWYNISWAGAGAIQAAGSPPPSTGLYVWDRIGGAA